MHRNQKSVKSFYLKEALAGRLCSSPEQEIQENALAVSLSDFPMENVFFFVPGFIFLFLFLSASVTITAQPPPLPIPPPQQLSNIIDALIGAGDFTSWVSILSVASPLVLPLSATLFVPRDGGDLDSDHHPAMDPLLFPYHIVPQRLTFSDLLLFKPNTRLPTLLPAMSISITNNSRSNYTIDGIPITHPDLYATDSIAVHGIAAVLDYSVFGNSFPLLPTPTTATTSGDLVPEVLTPPPPAEGILTSPFVPIGGSSTGWMSDAACSCTEVPIIFLIFCGVLAFKMQRIPFVR